MTRLAAVLVLMSLLLSPTFAARSYAAPARDSLTFCTGQDISTMNVVFTAAGLALSLSKFAQRGLLFYDENDTFTGELAEQVPTVRNGGISTDLKTITYKLKKNVTWHDGKPVTAKDVVFTWKTIMNPANRVISRFGYDLIEDIATPDDFTAVVKFKQPFAPFRVIFDALLPEHILGRVPDINENAFNRGPVGFGPYRAVEWQQGSHITYEANPKYFRGAPKTRRIVARFFPGTEPTIAAVRAGDCDIAWGFGAAHVPELRRATGYQVVKNELPSSHRYAFNLMHNKVALWSDIRVRRAIAQAIDRRAIIEKLLFGLTEPGTTEWGQTYWENKNVPQLQYDQARARALLDEAGWRPGPDGIRVKDGQRLSFNHTTYTGDQLLADTQAVIQQQLKDVGVEMRIRNLSLPILFAPYRQGGIWAVGDYEMGGWFHGLRNPDPDLSVRFASWERPSDRNPTGAQWYHYANPRVDELLRRQARVFVDADRKRMVDEIQRVIANDYAVIYLWKHAEFYAVRQGVENFKPKAWGNFYWNMYQWERK
jgi:peptide/nickel transport system substrate-binding protein